MNLKKIEEIELYYLEKYAAILSGNKREIIRGLDTKKDILDDWIGRYGGKDQETSLFDKGAERVLYSYINSGTTDAKPNSSPVGSDMFYEYDDAYLHLDLKSISASQEEKGNLPDFSDIFIGENQNSYKSKILFDRGGTPRDYIPNLPPIYNAGKLNEKICLTYLITLAFDMDNFDTLIITLQCIPNGLLHKHYGDRVIKAGKNPGKARFRLTDSRSGIKGVNKFELLEGSPQRFKVIYLKENLPETYKNDLAFFMP